MPIPQSCEMLPFGTLCSVGMSDDSYSQYSITYMYMYQLYNLIRKVFVLIIKNVNE